MGGIPAFTAFTNIIWGVPVSVEPDVNRSYLYSYAMDFSGHFDDSCDMVALPVICLYQPANGRTQAYYDLPCDTYAHDGSSIESSGRGSFVVHSLPGASNFGDVLLFGVHLYNHANASGTTHGHASATLYLERYEQDLAIQEPAR